MTEHRTPDYRQSLSEVINHVSVIDFCFKLNNVRLRVNWRRLRSWLTLIQRLLSRKSWKAMIGKCCKISLNLIYLVKSNVFNFHFNKIVLALRRGSGQMQSSFTQRQSRGIPRQGLKSNFVSLLTRSLFSGCKNLLQSCGMLHKTKCFWSHHQGGLYDHPN